MDTMTKDETKEVINKTVKVANFIEKENMSPIEIIAICANLLEGWNSKLVLSKEKDELMGILCGNSKFINSHS